MKYERISKELFIRNREKFVTQMDNQALAVFNSNDVYPISADSAHPFQQHRDIFYLSGVDQEESILVLFPNASKHEFREILFLKKTDEHIAIWEGEKLTKQVAYETSGIKLVYWLDQFESIFKQLMAETDIIYVNINEHLRASNQVETREDRFIKRLVKDYPAHQLRRSAPLLHHIRSVKEKEEIELIQKACSITEAGLRRVLNFVKPGVWEYEVEAEFSHEFLKSRSRGFAYSPIIASGKNACVLHYVDNNKQCMEGDLLLLDVGAEYANYASDLTRCIPVSGRFSERQKEVYNAILHVKREAEKLLVPGTILADYHLQVGSLMEEQLLKLKLIHPNDILEQRPEFPAYKKYYMHGTSHFLGLDTHDVGLWNEPIRAGMVFTCEPGIYIREEGLGIRIEDDLVVQEQGAPLNLMASIPIEVEEIEDLMNGR
jgi:Xaa-Pro aminopeptidase